MIKKSLAILFFLVILSALALGEGNKITVSLTKESIKAGEPITIKVSLLDSQDSPINAEVNITLEDAEKKTQIEKTIMTNSLVDIDLGENPAAGYWTVTARYFEEDGEITEGKTIFSMELNKLAKFELDNDVLAITNIGNSRYTETVQIVIGETVGTKKVDLGVGEKTSFRLLAPDGAYKVRITDGKTTLERSNVMLTGNVIGILDERLKKGGTLTGIVNSDEEKPALIDKNYIYVFFIVITGVAMLLIVERFYRKKMIKLKQ